MKREYSAPTVERISIRIMDGIVAKSCYNHYENTKPMSIGFDCTDPIFDPLN